MKKDFRRLFKKVASVFLATSMMFTSVDVSNVYAVGTVDGSAKSYNRSVSGTVNITDNDGNTIASVAGSGNIQYNAKWYKNTELPPKNSSNGDDIAQVDVGVRNVNFTSGAVASKTAKYGDYCIVIPMSYLAIYGAEVSELFEKVENLITGNKQNSNGIIDDLTNITIYVVNDAPVEMIDEIPNSGIVTGDGHPFNIFLKCPGRDKNDVWKVTVQPGGNALAGTMEYTNNDNDLDDGVETGLNVPTLRSNGFSKVSEWCTNAKVYRKISNTSADYSNISDLQYTKLFEHLKSSSYDSIFWFTNGKIADRFEHADSYSGGTATIKRVDRNNSILQLNNSSIQAKENQYRASLNSMHLARKAAIDGALNKINVLDFSDSPLKSASTRESGDTAIIGSYNYFFEKHGSEHEADLIDFSLKNPSITYYNVLTYYDASARDEDTALIDHWNSSIKEKSLDVNFSRAKDKKKIELEESEDKINEAAEYIYNTMVNTASKTQTLTSSVEGTVTAKVDFDSNDWAQGIDENNISTLYCGDRVDNISALSVEASKGVSSSKSKMLLTNWDTHYFTSEGGDYYNILKNVTYTVKGVVTYYYDKSGHKFEYTSFEKSNVVTFDESNKLSLGRVWEFPVPMSESGGHYDEFIVRDGNRFIPKNYGFSTISAYKTNDFNEGYGTLSLVYNRNKTSGYKVDWVDANKGIVRVTYKNEFDAKDTNMPPTWVWNRFIKVIFDLSVSTKRFRNSTVINMNDVFSKAGTTFKDIQVQFGVIGQLAGRTWLTTSHTGYEWSQIYAGKWLSWDDISNIMKPGGSTTFLGDGIEILKYDKSTANDYKDMTEYCYRTIKAGVEGVGKENEYGTCVIFGDFKTNQHKAETAGAIYSMKLHNKMVVGLCPISAGGVVNVKSGSPSGKVKCDTSHTSSGEVKTRDKGAKNSSGNWEKVKGNKKYAIESPEASGSGFWVNDSDLRQIDTIDIANCWPFEWVAGKKALKATEWDDTLTARNALDEIMKREELSKHYQAPTITYSYEVRNCIDYHYWDVCDVNGNVIQELKYDPSNPLEGSTYLEASKTNASYDGGDSLTTSDEFYLKLKDKWLNTDDVGYYFPVSYGKYIVAQGNVKYSSEYSYDLIRKIENQPLNIYRQRVNLTLDGNSGDGILDNKDANGRPGLVQRTITKNVTNPNVMPSFKFDTTKQGLYISDANNAQQGPFVIHETLNEDQIKEINGASYTTKHTDNDYSTWRMYPNTDANGVSKLDEFRYIDLTNNTEFRMLGWSIDKKGWSTDGVGWQPDYNRNWPDANNNNRGLIVNLALGRSPNSILYINRDTRLYAQYEPVLRSSLMVENIPSSENDSIADKTASDATEILQKPGFKSGENGIYTILRCTTNDLYESTKRYIDVDFGDITELGKLEHRDEDWSDKLNSSTDGESKLNYSNLNRLIKGGNETETRNFYVPLKLNSITAQPDSTTVPYGLHVEHTVTFKISQHSYFWENVKGKDSELITFKLIIKPWNPDDGNPPPPPPDPIPDPSVNSDVITQILM